GAHAGAPLYRSSTAIPLERRTLSALILAVFSPSGVERISGPGQGVGHVIAVNVHRAGFGQDFDIFPNQIAKTGFLWVADLNRDRICQDLQIAANGRLADLARSGSRTDILYGQVSADIGSGANREPGSSLDPYIAAYPSVVESQMSAVYGHV